MQKKGVQGVECRLAFCTQFHDYPFYRIPSLQHIIGVLSILTFSTLLFDLVQSKVVVVLFDVCPAYEWGDDVVDDLKREYTEHKEKVETAAKVSGVYLERSPGPLGNIYRVGKWLFT